ncbi:MAG: PilZ domain-containing protein [Desulfobacterales bacterium]
MIMANRIDRRMHKRFKVCDESFAFIENGSKILCKINNISKGGLSLVTIANGEHIPDFFDTDIFVTGRVFYLRNVPSKKVSEACLDSKSLFTTFVKSQVGIQFGDLDTEQSALLDKFIQKHATIEDISEC